MTRTVRAVSNLASSVAFSVIGLLLALWSTPYLLRWLGDETYGAFRVASDWFVQLSILEVGLGSALLPLLAQARATGGGAAVASVLSAGVRSYVRVALGMLAIGLMVGWFLPDFIQASAELRRDIHRGWLIAMASLLILPLSPFRALADASQRGYLISAVLFLQTIVVTMLALIFARHHWGVTGQFAALGIGSVVFHLALTLDGFRRHRTLSVRRLVRETDPDAEQQLHQLNRPTLLFHLAGRVSLLTDNIVIAAVMGAQAVVPLVLTQRLIQVVAGQLQGIGGASWAGLAELHARGEGERMAARVIEASKLISGIGAVVLVPIVAFNQVFISRWVGPQHFAGTVVTTVAALNAIILALMTLWFWCFTGTGQLPKIVPATLVWALVNLVLSVGLTVWLGWVGPLLGTLASYVLVTLWYVPLELKRTFGIRLSSLARASIFPLLLAILPAAGWLYFAHRWPPLTWPALIGAMAVAGTLQLGLFWLLALDREERRLYRERMRHVLDTRRRQPGAGP